MRERGARITSEQCRPGDVFFGVTTELRLHVSGDPRGGDVTSIRRFGRETISIETATLTEWQ
jgi:hypothetical protein